MVTVHTQHAQHVFEGALAYLDHLGSLVVVSHEGGFMMAAFSTGNWEYFTASDIEDDEDEAIH